MSFPFSDELTHCYGLDIPSIAARRFFEELACEISKCYLDYHTAARGSRSILEQEPI